MYTAGRLSSVSSLLPVSDSEPTIRRYPGLELPTSLIIHPESSAAPSRPLTTAFEASVVSLNSIFTLRPMKTKDINIVFSNIAELAEFSEEFLDQLESALGELIEGNEGEDYVGSFFLDFVRSFYACSPSPARASDYSRCLTPSRIHVWSWPGVVIRFPRWSPFTRRTS